MSKRIEELERISGTGPLAGASFSSIQVDYEIEVLREIHTTGGFGGRSESAGAVDYDTIVHAPGSALRPLLAAYAKKEELRLSLEGGRHAYLRLSEGPGFPDEHGIISVPCRVRLIDPEV